MRSCFGQTVLVWLLVAGGAALLAGCSTVEPEPRVEYRTVNVAVAAPCVDNPPVAVPSISAVVSPEEWATLAPGAKAQTVAAQAGERMNYEDRLRAATSGCRVIGSPQSSSTGGPENLLPAGSVYQDPRDPQ